MSNYPGNKSPTTLFPKIIGSFPAHEVYWELFLGSGEISKKKKPAKLNIGVELDLTTIDQFKNIYPSGTVVINTCAISLLDDLKHLGKKHLIYADPPYIIEDRRAKKALYGCELTLDQHKTMLNKFLECRSFVVISHYQSSLYDEMLLSKGWYRVDIPACYHGKKVTEAIYMNFPPAEKLHETTFVGKNKTQRQAIKRKGERWIKNLLKMQADERQYVLERIAHLPKM